MNNIVKCAICDQQPHQLSEYVWAAEDEGLSPEEYVKDEEVTFNSDNNLFYCTACYIAAGMPPGKAQQRQ
jgi:hypothetical protein